MVSEDPYTDMKVLSGGEVGGNPYLSTQIWTGILKPMYFIEMFVWHIEAKTKWSPFRRQNFQKYFLEWQCLNFA